MSTAVYQSTRPGTCSQAYCVLLLLLLQDFRVARARRVKPVIAFATETGRAAYDVLKEAASEEEAAQMAMGWGTEEMTNEQFEHYVYDLEFEPLGPVQAPTRR